MSSLHSTAGYALRERSLPKLDRLAARVVLDRLARWREGRLSLTLPDGSVRELGVPAAGEQPLALHVHEWRFFRRLLLGGDIGAGESYVDGDWSCSDLVRLCALVVRDQSVLDDASPWRLGSRLVHAVRRLREANTRRGSRRNIRHHYDLGNDFFRLFLDESLTYSAGVYARPGATLAEAQREKLDGICRAIGVRAGQHVLEIGSGWGSFALHAATHYGARVTSLTLSAEQQRLASERVAAAGLRDRVDIQLRDYRAMRGRFDHLVSIEMFEAVGFAYYDAFFAACERLLAPGGTLFLQTIAIPDQGFARYRRDYDWLRKYIFPGSLLASLHGITDSLRRVTRLRIESLRDIGPDYARTLADWRQRFLARRDAVRRLGFDERFLRLWEFYLASCEAAFAVRYLSDLQLVMRRPLTVA
ncbi:class I SAM-dependent methyltransferase [bacterium]|nr:class I SAM-dependent methyltransferase [bacterium]